MWRRFLGRAFWRFVWILIAWGIGAGTAFYFKTEVLHWLLIPADGKLSPFPGGLPVFVEPTGALTATFGVASRGGLLFALPVAGYALYTLFSPALPKRFHMGRIMLVLSAVLSLFFLAGVAFAYYVMMPRMLAFLLSFADGIAVPLISIEQYLGLLFAMMFWMGVIFQLPVAMFLLAKLDIVSYQRLRHMRRVTMIFAIIMSIIITPTFDGISMGLMAIPIYAMYELGLFFAWLARPEDGNYLFIGTISRAIRKVFRVIRAIVYSPYTVPRWLFRKVFRLWR